MFVKISATIRNSFFRIINKEFLTFLVFLAMSTGFWFVMTLNETYERDIAIPIRIIDVPKNVIITDGLPDSVHIMVKDKGYSLLPYFHGDKIKEVQIPFNTYANKNTGKGSISATELQKLIYPNLFVSTTIVSVKSDKLEFFFNYGLSKRVPVVFDGQVSAAEQYYLARTQFSPATVLVYASKEKLKEISEVSIEPLNIEDLKDTLSQEVALKKIRGAKIEPSKVTVSLYGDLLTEKVIELPIIPINVPDGYRLHTFPSTVKVKVAVGRNNISQVTPSNFRVVADYREVANTPSDKCSLTVTATPEAVTNATLEFSSVDYLIEKSE